MGVTIARSGPQRQSAIAGVVGHIRATRKGRSWPLVARIGATPREFLDSREAVSQVGDSTVLSREATKPLHAAPAARGGGHLSGGRPSR